MTPLTKARGNPVGSAAAIVSLACVSTVAGFADAQPRAPGTVRIATFNIFELSCAKIAARDPQVRKATEILRRVQPDIVLVNEIDYSTEPDCAARFADALGDAREGVDPLGLAHRVYLPVNTGVPSGFDFNNDGDTGDPEDAFGYGRYPGQYGMLLLSRYPIDASAVRTFQRFLWKDMPGHLMPDGRDGRPAFYSTEEASQYRLSSKSHWDVPVRIGDRIVHLLASHPTPAIFDGPEDANGRRNFDEIRLWADYLAGGDRAGYLTDDQGRRGGLAADASCIVLGDLNADPVQDLTRPYGRTAASHVVEHPRLQDPRPTSDGALPLDPARPYPGENRTRTTTYGRIDYVLPSRDLEVVGSGVWNPAASDPLHALVAPPNPPSDHFLVWVDLRLSAP
jgi:endonuclease/exonuclease/phosphatase family metal-dependent hydrolase